MLVFCYTISMNTKLVIIGVIVLAITAMIGIGFFSTPEQEDPEGTYVDEDYVPTRPDVQAKPNTFKVLTPEEKAAEEEEAQRAAAEAALNASSSATTTASSTLEDTDESE